MPKYAVKKIFQYSEIVEVEACSREDAKYIAQEIDGDRIHDDTLIDCEIVSEAI